LNESENKDDIGLIVRVLSGDKEAFAQIVRRYHNKVYQLCAGMLGPSHEAEDATQDIFVKTYQRLPTFRQESSFSTWLYRLSSNHCLDLLRFRRRHKTQSWEGLLAEKGEKIEQLLTSRSDEMAVLEARGLAFSLLSQIKPDYQLLLSLREIDGLSYQEIAQVLNISLDSVKAKLRRARQEMDEKFRHFLKTQNV